MALNPSWSQVADEDLPPSVDAHRMPLQTAVIPVTVEHETTEDWTNVTDKDARRKIRSKLNQRARRRRLKPQMLLQIASLETPNDAVSNNGLLFSPRDPDMDRELFRRPHTDSTLPMTVNGSALFCELQQTQSTLNKLHFPLAPDNLLTLVHFNVYRALLTNSSILSLIHKIFDCHSPVVRHITPLPLPGALPPQLMPTILQQQIENAPWIDLCPLPALRDNFILAGNSLDHQEMCLDLMGTLVQNNGLQNTRSGFVVWGDPWNIDSWEMTEGFVQKWKWLLGGCEDVLIATNRWRRVRGEHPIVLEPKEDICFTWTDTKNAANVYA